MNMPIRYTVLALLAGLLFFSPAWAQPGDAGHDHGKAQAPKHGAQGQGGMGHQGGGMMGMMGHHKGGMHGGKHKKGGMMFTPPWMKTLSDEQKLEIDRMHLEVAKVERPLRAKMKLAQLELNVLVTQDKPDAKAIKRAIEKVTQLKAKIMQNRYDHIVEMRAILTPQQRISYDMGILDVGLGEKKKHRH